MAATGKIASEGRGEVLQGSLREIGEKGEVYEVTSLSHQREFDRVWSSLTTRDRDAIVAEINQRLEQLMHSPNPNWGSITNTSIEGGKTNPNTGIRGDWSGTVFQAIFNFFRNGALAGMFYGNVWKKVIIDRPELWVGIRSDPTFPQRGITLQGKTYFLDAAWNPLTARKGHAQKSNVSITRA